MGKAAKHSAGRILLCMGICLAILAMLLHPQTAVDAAKQGLLLWAQVVAPSLLPFFLLCDCLVRLGAAERAGRRLQPLMGPLFYLPGAASVALLMGFCSGFPMGAALTASLYREGLLSREQAARLAAFTNNASPMFITVAVAAGLLHSPGAALLLAGCHYGSNLLLGIGLGLYARGKQKHIPLPASGKAAPAPAPAGFSILKEAAQRAASNLLMIACYMTLCSVLATLIVPADAGPFGQMLASGLFEISLGCQSIAQSGLPLPTLLCLTAVQLAFGGLSVQAQVASLLAAEGIPLRPYLLCRIGQAVLAGGLTLLLQDKLLQPSAAAASANIAPLPLALLFSATGLLIWLLWLKPGRPDCNI